MVETNKTIRVIDNHPSSNSVTISDLVTAIPGVGIPSECQIWASFNTQNFFPFLGVRFLNEISFVNPIPGTPVWLKPVWVVQDPNTLQTTSYEGEPVLLGLGNNIQLHQYYNKINPIFRDGGVYDMGLDSNASLLDEFAFGNKVIFKEDAKLFNNDSILGGNNSTLTVVGPSGINYDDTVLICNSVSATKGEAKGDGPVWGDRQYNVTGRVHNFTVYRAGDWVKGREGHGLYFNVGGDLSFLNCQFVECGAQGLQLIYRTTEGMGLAGKLPAPGSTISIEACSFFDCGQITAINPATNNYNHNERASYPITIGGWTENVEITNCYIECYHPRPYKKANPSDEAKYFSKGALVVWNGGNPVLRTKRVTITDLSVNIKASDRTPIRLQGINEAFITSLSINHEENIDNLPDLSIAGDVDVVFISPQLQDLKIRTYIGASESGSEILSSITVPKGKSCNIVKGVPTIF